MLPLVANAILTCFSAAPAFGGFGSAIEELGFKETGQQNRDVRWSDSNGVEVFLSQLPAQRVCSVWFNGSVSSEVGEMPKLPRDNGYKLKELSAQSEPTWLVDKNWFFKLLTKQGDDKRVGAALFVLRN